MSESGEKRLRLVQITDCHLLAHPEETLLGVPTLAALRLVVEEVFERLAPVDGLVLTGDLSQDGSRESYRLLRDVVGEFRVPAYWLPGNHDAIEPLREVLGGEPFSSGPLATFGDWRLILLDSVVPGQDYGELGEEQFRILDAALDDGTNAIVFVHHPPLDLGCPWLDTMRLRNGPRLLSALQAHDHCRALVFGHAHQEYASRFGKQHLYCTPATCFQFKPHTGNFALDSLPPGCRVFDLLPDGRLHTFVHRLPLFPFVPSREATGY